MYLTLNDLNMLIKADILDRVISSDELILQQGIMTAVEEAQSYLRHRYDVADIFGKVGTERSAWLVAICCDLALYHLHSRINPRSVPQIRQDRYDAAIRWLEKVMGGLIVPDLPQVLPTDPNNIGAMSITYQGDARRNNRY